MNEKILIVEDEQAILDSVAYALKSEGFRVSTAMDGVAGLSEFKTFTPDLIILDLMLPKLNGLDFCRAIRKESDVPIIMLTAKTEEVDRIVGLELGADDYVTKPFGIKELVARVKAVLRRTEHIMPEDQKTNIQVGNIKMDILRRRVMVNDNVVHLPLKQYELLKVLITNPNKVLTRDELIKSVWNTDSNIDSGSLDVHIRWLREKIEEDASKPKYLKTIRGIGYKFVSSSE